MHCCAICGTRAALERCSSADTPPRMQPDAAPPAPTPPILITSPSRSLSRSIVPTGGGLTYIQPSPSPVMAAAPTGTAATANVTGPTKPAPGSNLVVVLTVPGTDAAAILKNQK